MNPTTTTTADLVYLKENPSVYGGEEPHAMLWWADDSEDHPYWVIDHLEGMGWTKHLPELDYDEKITGVTVEYDPEARTIERLTTPDGTEHTEN